MLTSITKELLSLLEETPAGRTIIEQRAKRELAERQRLSAELEVARNDLRAAGRAQSTASDEEKRLRLEVERAREAVRAAEARLTTVQLMPSIARLNADDRVQRIEGELRASADPAIAALIHRLRHRHRDVIGMRPHKQTLQKFTPKPGSTWVGTNEDLYYSAAPSMVRLLGVIVEAIRELEDLQLADHVEDLAARLKAIEGRVDAMRVEMERIA